jgi:hypothetical protein
LKVRIKKEKKREREISVFVTKDYNEPVSASDEDRQGRLRYLGLTPICSQESLTGNWALKLDPSV